MNNHEVYPRSKIFISNDKKNRSSWQEWYHEWCQEDFSYVANLSLLQPTTETSNNRPSSVNPTFCDYPFFLETAFFGEQLFLTSSILSSVSSSDCGILCAFVKSLFSWFCFSFSFALCFQGWRSLFELHYARLYRVLLLYIKFQKKSRAKVLRGCFLLLAAQFRLLEKSRFLERLEEFQKQRWDSRELWQYCWEFVGRLNGVLIRDLKAF